VAGLDVLREHEHADLWMAVLDLLGGTGAFVGESRRHSDIDHDQVGAMSCDCRDQLPRIPAGRRHFVPAVGKQPSQALAQQHLVLGDHDPHGSSAVSVVPSSGALDIRAAAVSRDPVLQPTQTAAVFLDDAAGAVICDAND
jgi:hypothetical protein